MTRLAWLYALLLAFAAAWLGWGIAQGGRLQTDLTALLPADAQVDAVWRAADEAGEKQLNGQILLLVGSEDADRAFAAAEQVADRWQQSGLFAAVDSRLNPDLAQLRQEIRRLGVNALPREQQQLLLHDPAAYFQQRAEDAANPFTAQIVPLEDDWLGFARFVQQKQPSGRLQWHSGNGMMYSEQDGITWVWLRARLPEKAAADQAERLLPLLADSRAQAERGGYRLLAAGGALFAAEAKTQSERESGLMSTIGLSLTFALLLAVFRSPRVFALVLPLGAGMLLGAAAVVGAFGQIHILTVVIGTSLVGMLVDFPLHWLTPSVFSPDWAAKEAMRRVLPAFLAGLGITATGYLLLAFTPLPVLRQTAVFSVAALGGAFAATVLLLPPLFHGYRPRAARFAAAMHKLAAAQPVVPLDQALSGQTAEAWRTLYLGNIQGQEAALVRVQGLNDAAAVQTALSALPCNQGGTCARLVDKRARLNELFRHTRNHAAWLKLASFALAWLVLWRIFGARRGSLILAVPMISAAATVGLLGWLGLPVSLFAMFGLLLVAAVGADYAVYALTARETPAAKLGGILLAALTTAISFLLLAISTTPAVAAFGITVSLGVGLNVLLSAWLLKKEGAEREAV